MLHTFCTYLQRHTFTKRLCLVVMGYTLVTSACLGTTEEQHVRQMAQYIKKHDLDAVRNLLEKNQHLAKERDRHRRSVLHYACHEESLPIIRLCIQYGANVSIADVHHQTPLLYILLWKNDKDKLEALSLLADHHVNWNAQDDGGQTGLHRVCLTEYLLGADFLLRHGINYHIQDRLQRTALHCACVYNNLDLITVVTNVPDVGALLKIKNREGKTPRAIAEEKGYKEIVAFLDAQAALSDKHLVATAGLTRENSSYVIDAIVHLIVSYLLFQRCSTT